MLKKHYIEFEKKLLEDSPLSPYELTAAGIADLRKNIIVNIFAFSLFCIIFLMFVRHGSFYDWGYSIGLALAGSDEGSYFPFVYFVGFLTALFGSLAFFGKTMDALTETGLWMRVSATDEFLDEWEIEQKRKSCTAAYEIVIWTFIALFLVGVIGCGLHFLLADRLPDTPRFGTVVTASLIAIWIMVLLPVSYVAWTLEPVEDDAVDGPITKPAPAPKPVLTAKQKGWKWFWNIAPFIVGGTIGVLWAINN